MKGRSSSIFLIWFWVHFLSTAYGCATLRRAAAHPDLDSTLSIPFVKRWERRAAILLLALREADSPYLLSLSLAYTPRATCYTHHLCLFVRE